MHTPYHTYPIPRAEKSATEPGRGMLWRGIGTFVSMPGCIKVTSSRLPCIFCDKGETNPQVNLRTPQNIHISSHPVCIYMGKLPIPTGIEGCTKKAEAQLEIGPGCTCHRSPFFYHPSLEFFVGSRHVGSVSSGAFLTDSLASNPLNHLVVLLPPTPRPPTPPYCKKNTNFR